MTMPSSFDDQALETAIAIIGMSGRFPGATDTGEFWQNIAAGVRSIRSFTDAELLAAGVDPALLQQPNYVKAGTVLDQVDQFDAAFFGYPPREAEIMDPQHRLFLECAWEALEHAAYNPEVYSGLIGVFAGSAFSGYALHNIASNQELIDLVGAFQVDLNNNVDSLASTVSYKLNLRGPSVVVQTFCSTSLVAVHMACQGLITYEIDIALAGGVAIMVPHGQGYLYQEGGIVSPDGRVRTFDANAKGSVMGSGAGVVVLKRLSEALADGDQIYAVIRGSAANNDGIRKVGYTAPGLAGQSSVIARALSNAGVKPETISYVEAHGTATPLGDSVELAAMIKAFQRGTNKRQFCAIGSVKPNVGHLDRASGVTGLIKTSLALHHQLLPPSIEFESADPELDLPNSPFYVNTSARAWPRNGTPRRAGVSSFGLGGTNAHVVLEEAPERPKSSLARPHQLLLLSAKTVSALDAATANLAAFLRRHPDANLADVAYTLQVGRAAFAHRRTLVCHDTQDAIGALETRDATRVLTQYQTSRDRPVAFLFPGAGEHYAGMARELYQTEPLFREAIDRCCALLQPHLGRDLREVLYPIDDKATRRQGDKVPSEADSVTLSPPHRVILSGELAEPALFVVEYALGQLLIGWGVQPTAMLGYGVGEYVAACVAGVLDLADALKLVVAWAKLTQAPNQSHTLVPTADELTPVARTLTLKAPTTPYLSSITGTWVTAEQATDPAYWGRLYAEPARLAEGIAQLLATPQLVLVEVGPGQALSSLVKSHPLCGRERFSQIIPTLPGIQERISDRAGLLSTLGKLWLANVPLDWQKVYEHEQRRRLPLPTYPFERQRCWIDPPQAAAAGTRAIAAGKHADIADWFYVPRWQPAPLLRVPATSRAHWLVIGNVTELGDRLCTRLIQAGHTVIQVRAGVAFARLDKYSFELRLDQRADYEALLGALRADALFPTHVLHLGCLGQLEAAPSPATFRAQQSCGYYSLLALAQALGPQLIDEPVQFFLMTQGLQPVNGDEPIRAEQAPLLGLGTVVSQEYSTITCRSIDLLPPAPGESSEALAAQLIVEITTATDDLAVAYRGATRWVQSYLPQRMEMPAAPPLRSQGVYIITGGLGGVARIIARHLAQTVQAKLVLVGRTALPPREAWAAYRAHGDETDYISQAIRHIEQLEALGAQVLLFAADVGDASQLRAVIDETMTRFGALHGIVHAAGISDGRAFALIPDTTTAQCEAHFQPKAYGLYALEHALADRALDFCIICSSIASVLGGLSFAGYAAANRFIDAFVQRHNRNAPTPWISVNWDTWRLKDGQHDAIGATVAQYEMLPDEALQVFERVAAARDYAQIVISTGDLDTRIRQWVLMETLRADQQEQNTLPAGPLIATTSAYEQRITGIWQQVLGVEEVGLHDNFFELGGNSLIALQVIAKLKKEFQTQVPAVALFEAPTVSALAQYLLPEQPTQADQQQALLEQRREQARRSSGSSEIAIVAMVGRFPGARTLDQFWQNLRDGVESCTRFSDAELLAAGVDPLLIANPNYVKMRPILEDVEQFDAAFFGYTPREAELLDPQQRLFHEVAWEALETAGYDTQRYPGLVGVFAGANMNSYLLRLIQDPALVGLINESVVLENDKDALTTNVSYKLNLRGPSFAVQTYCSTSLVATHLACRSLRAGECDLALAGGVSVRVPVRAGYLYQEGDQVSPDGHVRTFDADGAGATFGDGVAVVVLKRLADALADGDTIHAVIKGSAINNDGGLKVGYTAPSVIGQADVIRAALADAQVDPASISYVEAHGTATKLGDPIEVAALTKAFRTRTQQVGYCALSSVKPNVGHLDRAAGATGLIKTVLALHHSQIPPTLHFQRPNPELALESSPFYVPNSLRAWPRNGHPRRAGVNSLGVGGTNAHVVLEEAPPVPPSAPSREVQLLVLSAKTASALEAATANLAIFLAQEPGVELADVAYTLQVGRRVFEHRRALVCRDHDEALRLLAAPDRAPVRTAQQAPLSRSVAFLFGGVGDHYMGMAEELYRSESSFRATIDRCCALLQPHLGLELRSILYPQEQRTKLVLSEVEGNKEQTAQNQEPRTENRLTRSPAHPLTRSLLNQTEYAQPAVFVVEYALAQLLIGWGVRPSALLGYSVGEYVAACLSGVLSLEDALKLVATRARLIASQPAGAMLAVMASEEQVQPFLREGVELAIVNGPQSCVLAGPPTAIDAVAEQLAQHEIACRSVPASHAFHTRMLAPIADELTALVRTLKLHPPAIPYISNVTGTWITAEQATDPAYWARHMLETVRFSEGVAALLATPEQVFVEVGAGQALSSFVKGHPECGRARFNQVHATLPSAQERGQDLARLLEALGALWLLDVSVDAEQFYAHEQRRRVPLPTYPFERRRFWVEPDAQRVAPRTTPPRRSDVAEWFSVPSWKRAAPIDHAEAEAKLAERRHWLVLTDSIGIGGPLVEWLRARNQHVISVIPGPGFTKLADSTYMVEATSRADYDALFQDLGRRGILPQRVVQLWPVVTPPDADGESDVDLSQVLDHGFYSLLALTKALGDLGVESCRIDIVSSNMQEVTAAERLCAAKATLMGPARIISQEYPNLSCRSIDLMLPDYHQRLDTGLIDRLALELVGGTQTEPIVALRGPHRWIKSFETVHIPASTIGSPLRQHGVYLITGGLGGIGLALAEDLAQRAQARLVLLGRSALPPREQWPHILATHDLASGVGRRVRIISDLEARGTQVLVLQADVTDVTQVRAAVQQALLRFGALDGVFHTAGVPGVGLMQLKTPEAATGVLAPKVHGTLALAQALRDVPLDFLVLFSSITSATGGGPGQVDYCAANAFLDVYARRHAHDHGHTIAISWGEWLWDAWQEGLQGFPEEVRAFMIANRRAFGISFSEGMEALQRMLARPLPHVFVTTQDLNWMVEGSRRTSAAVALEELQAQTQARALYPRPALSTAYSPPESELEETIAAIWGQVLGIDEIGSQDNFFELGGNSLIGLQITTRLRQAFKVPIPLTLLFEAPTVAEMAIAVEIILIDNLEQLDDVEALQLLESD